MSEDENVKDGETPAVGEEAAAADDWAAAMEEQDVAESEESVDSLGFEEFDNDPTAGKSLNPELDIILDIPVTISMEVGSTSITIRNLLQLNQGSVIELDRLAGEPLNVLVNGTLIAHGEVVVVNEKFGIRMTDVISPSERIKKLS
jgi:flagellar motor switch protein FliN/FliY